MHMKAKITLCEATWTPKDGEQQSCLRQAVMGVTLPDAPGTPTKLCRTCWGLFRQGRTDWIISPLTD